MRACACLSLSNAHTASTAHWSNRASASTSMCVCALCWAANGFIYLSDDRRVATALTIWNVSQLLYNFERICRTNAMCVCMIKWIKRETQFHSYRPHATHGPVWQCRSSWSGTLNNNSDSLSVCLQFRSKSIASRNIMRIMCAHTALIFWRIPKIAPIAHSMLHYVCHC